ncbi:MAG: amidohydrolase family protein, partial [Anaerolineae bacterium]
VASKIWKNVGMRLRKPSGTFLMVDDPLFDPIYEYLASVGKPVLMHIGEPLACWRPLDAHNAHAGYYAAHPEWYMGDKPDHPSHAQLIEARDSVLARHPRLRVIGAHLGSLEYDVAEIGRRLDRFANFAVDTSARLGDLARQDPSVVREFFLRYQDRILFGTDIVQRQPVSELNEEARSSHLASVSARYQLELGYLRSQAKVNLGGIEAPGLALPAQVVEKVVYRNAKRWYPGL